MDLVEHAPTSLPILLFTAVVGLYTTVRVLDSCCESLSLAISASNSTEPLIASEHDNPATYGLGPDQASPRTSSDDLGCDSSHSRPPKFETDFVDVEVDAQRFSASTLVPQSNSSQTLCGREELEQLLSFSDLDPRLSTPQIWIDFAPRSLYIQVLEENREQACPQTPRVGFGSCVSSPDSGYHSGGSPQSVFEANSISSDTDDSNRWDGVDMNPEPEEFESESTLWIELDNVQQISPGSPISLDHLVNCHGIEPSVNLGITVLDRGTGLRLPLSTALSTKDLRKRTGLVLSLHNISEDRELRVRELIPWDNLGSVKAIISIWDRDCKALNDLSTILMTREARHRANVYIERCPSRFDQASSPRHPMSWQNLVRFLDLDGFYLGQLRDKGLDVHHQAEHGVGGSTKVCIRTKAAA